MTKSMDLVTDEILLQALKVDKGDVKLTSWSHDLDGNKVSANYFNVVERVKLNYEKEGKGETIKYIVKLNPCRGSEDEFNSYRYRAMVKEKFFYNEFLHVLNDELKELGENPLSVPRCFFAQVDEGKEIIVMEDLVERGFVNFPKDGTFDESHATLMMNEIAKLHAASISLRKKAGKDLLEVYPLLLESWMMGDPDLSIGFANYFTKACYFNANLAEALPEYEHLAKWLRDIAPRAMNVLLDNLKARNPWRMVCHADYQKGNVMFRYDSSSKPIDVVIFDWQTIRVANAASEIQYPAFSSCFSPDRGDIIAVSEDIYFDKLKKVFNRNNLSLPFTKEELRKEDESNHFSLLLLFCFIPLSLCVENTEHIFGKGGDELHQGNLEIYRKMLSENEPLKSISIGYLKEIDRRQMHINIR